MSLSYRLGSNSLFIRPHEDSIEPKRVVFLSTEGTKTEVQYFHFIEQYREQLGIDAIIHIEVLRRHDTNSDPENVLDLLEEYIHFRENNIFEKSIDSLRIKEYPVDFIKSYLEDPSNLPQRERKRFEAVLMEEHLDLLYLDFLSKYQGKDDAFGVVIDRDCGSHSLEQMTNVQEKCKAKNYLCYIINFIDITPRFLPVFAEKFNFEYLRKSHKIPLFSNKLVTPGYCLFRTRSETKPVYFTPLYVT